MHKKIKTNIKLSAIIVLLFIIGVVALISMVPHNKPVQAQLSWSVRIQQPNQQIYGYRLSVINGTVDAWVIDKSINQTNLEQLILTKDGRIKTERKYEIASLAPYVLSTIQNNKEDVLLIRSSDERGELHPIVADFGRDGSVEWAKIFNDSWVATAISHYNDDYYIVGSYGKMGTICDLSDKIKWCYTIKFSNMSLSSMPAINPMSAVINGNWLFVGGQLLYNNGTKHGFIFSLNLQNRSLAWFRVYSSTSSMDIRNVEYTNNGLFIAGVIWRNTSWFNTLVMELGNDGGVNSAYILSTDKPLAPMHTCYDPQSGSVCLSLHRYFGERYTPKPFIMSVSLNPFVINGIEDISDITTNSSESVGDISCDTAGCTTIVTTGSCRSPEKYVRIIRISKPLVSRNENMKRAGIKINKVQIELNLEDVTMQKIKFSVRSVRITRIS